MGDPTSHIHGRGGVYTPNFVAEQTAWCIHRGPPTDVRSQLLWRACVATLPGQLARQFLGRGPAQLQAPRAQVERVVGDAVRALGSGVPEDGSAPPAGGGSAGPTVKALK